MFTISSENFVTFLWLLGNASSAIGIILVNKLLVESAEFKYILTLTTLHFAWNYLFQALLGRLGVKQFQSDSSNNLDSTPLTTFQCIRLAALGTASVCTLNLSLTYNSVSLYQTFKLLCVPCMLLLQPLECLKLTWKVLTTLFMLIIGIAMATINDINFKTNFIGCILAFLAVLSTSIFQLQTAHLSQANQISPQQMNKTQALPTAIMCALAAFFVDFYPQANSILTYKFSVYSLFLMFSSCFISLLVNISTYGILSRCSALTFQVVGQIKTCAVLIGGWVLFPSARKQILPKTMIGIVLACTAALFYSYLKQNSNNTSIQRKYQLVSNGIHRIDTATSDDESSASIAVILQRNESEYFLVKEN